VTRRLLTVPLAVAVAAVACGGSADLSNPRLDLLASGLALRASDPARAAKLFAEAGTGTELERVRVSVWLSSLEASAAPAAEWRRLLAAEPPRAIEHAARLGLARSLAREGRAREAAEILTGAAEDGSSAADERLLELGPGPWLEPAARRLMVSSPDRMRVVAPDLERRLLPSLTPSERVERAAAWRQSGHPRTAAGELRPLRWRGDAEASRRLELAHAEIEGGSPSRALQAISAASLPETESQLLRAEAFRRRGWNRVPNTSATGAFRDCLGAARRAAAGAVSAADTEQALQLVIECGTEAGALDEALDAWRRLEGLGWSDPQRGWLGRRLGIAIAGRGTGLDAVEELASSLPDHARCLRFWSATATAANDVVALRGLAGSEVADLYGGWARELLGQDDARHLRLTQPLAAAALPATVEWLIDHDEERLAAGQWEAIASDRGVRPGEAVAAAELADRLDRGHDVVRWVLRACPELGTVDLERAPRNLVRAYLPLRWERALQDAARDSGIEPWLLAAVARQESLFVPYARSPRGAIGVLQLLPSTARMHARGLGIHGDPDLFDPEVNIRIGARELARLVRRFGDIEPALAAYNAGETRVRRWRGVWTDRRRFTEALPVPETYNYIRRVTYLADAYRLVYADVWREAP